ncbi:hypothetical protein [Novipirellula galeiformis]|nr:hypothetical protein [Novipirellula galeiformis]
MQHAFDLVLQFGEFSMLVIAVTVAAMMLLALLDRHPRDDPPGKSKPKK